MPICAIVGTGPRLGSGLARAFAEAGHDLVLMSRDTAHTADLAEEIAPTGSHVLRISVDATEPDSVRTAFHEVLNTAGLPDVVIYNPANMVMAPFSAVTASELEQTWPVMLYAAMNVTTAVLSEMSSRGSGTLIFTGGGFGIDPSVTRAPHSIAKAALRNYAHGLFLELRDQGIHACTVTVHRPLEPGDDMARCAAVFVAMSRESREAWSWEQHYGK